MTNAKEKEQKLSDRLKPRSIVTQSILLLLLILFSQLAALFSIVAIADQSEEVALKHQRNADLMESMDKIVIQFALAWGSLLDALLQRNPRSLQSSIDAQERLTISLSEITKLSHNDPALQKLLGRFDFLAERQTFMQKSLDSPLIKGLNDEQYSQLVQSLLLKRISPFIRDFQISQENVETFRAKHADNNISASSQRQELKYRVIILFLISSMASNLGILWFINRFVKRLRPLVSNAMQMRQNEQLQHCLKGDDELSALDKVLVETSHHLYKAQSEKQQILDMVAHDIRSPLSSAKLAMQRMSERRVNTINLEEFNIGIKQIETNLSVVLNMVGDLLENEKLRKGRFELDFTEVNTDEIVTETLNLLAGQLQAKSITVNLSVQSRNIIADRGRILQALTNIVSNAIKFSPFSSEIGIQVKYDQNTVLFRIRDRGPGLGSSPAGNEKLFDEYYQLPGAQKSNLSGFGLGLAIAKKIIEAHGGKIWAENNNDSVGATFAFYLPDEDDE